MSGLVNFVPQCLQNVAPRSFVELLHVVHDPTQSVKLCALEYIVHKKFCDGRSLIPALMSLKTSKAWMFASHFSVVIDTMFCRMFAL